MVHTTTLNPTLDWASLAEKLGFADANRIKQEQRYAGGKGIDVPKMLTRAGSEQYGTWIHRCVRKIKTRRQLAR